MSQFPVVAEPLSFSRRPSKSIDQTVRLNRPFKADSSDKIASKWL